MNTVLNAWPLPRRSISFLIADRWLAPIFEGSLIANQAVGCKLSAVG